MFSEHIFPLSLDGYGTGLCHKVASIIMAYAFDIPEKTTDALYENGSKEQDGDELVSDDEEDEPTLLSMIPLADMLNADSDRSNVRLCCDNEDLEMRAIKPISRGEELFIDHGSLPRSDLLRRYGYITSEDTYDVVEVSTDHLVSLFHPGGQSLDPKLQLDKSDLEKRIELCEREDIYDQSYDLKHADSDGPSIPDELLALVFILLLNEEALLKLANSQSHLPSRSKLETETAGHVLTTLLQQRENEYATTIEEDEALLESNTLSHRTRMACEVRLGEKIVLREAIQEAKAFSGSNKHMRGEQISEQGEKTKRTAEESSHPTKRGRFS
jgi:SET domain-containing protein 6